MIDETLDATLTVRPTVWWLIRNDRREAVNSRCDDDSHAIRIKTYRPQVGILL